MNIINISVIALKLFKCRILHLPTNSFCKECGRDVHDFITSDDIWIKIEPRIRFGHTLCYDCFCEKCADIGLPTYWKLDVSSVADVKNA